MSAQVTAAPDSAGVREGHQYAEDIVGGRIVACHWVRRACLRYLHDLEHAESRGYWFNEDLAQHYLDFPPNMLRLTDGKWAGEPFNLLPFQAFIDMNVYGWVNIETGHRRFQMAYEEVGRKNGKSPKLACNALQGLIVDEEPGAQVYTAATKREQAMIVLKYAQDMARVPDSGASRLVDVRKYAILSHNWVDEETGQLRTGGVMKAIGKNANTQDGFNPNFTVIDELHAHKDSGTLDVMSSSRGARDNWLLRMITTAGEILDGPCVEQREYLQLLLGDFDKPNGFKDDTFFGVIYTLDGWDARVEDEEKDDPLDPEVWIKANPGLGIIKSVEAMHTMARQAKQIPSKMAEFKMKHCCIWTSGSQKWVNMTHWDECEIRPVSIDDLRGREVWGGVDLASTTDVNAFVLVADSLTNDGLDVFCRFYVPEDALYSVDRNKKAHPKYPLWAEQGLLIATPGNVTDYNFIKADILGIDAVEGYELDDTSRLAAGVEGIAEVCDLNVLVFDRYNASQLVAELMAEGLNVTGIAQGAVSMNAPLRHIERLITNRTLNHGGNPVLNWMASNCLVKPNESDDIRLDKKAAQHKIDGMVALANAVGGYLSGEDSGTGSGIVIAGAA